MPRQHDLNPVSFAQVGFSFNDPSVSLTGICIDRSMIPQMTVPRVVIMEPKASGNAYDFMHDAYGEIIGETQQALGNDSDLLRVIRGDVYKQTSLGELPPVAFFVLENVLSDPYYNGEKDLQALVGLMSQVIVNGGIVLTLDSRISHFNDDERKLIEFFEELAVAGGDFTTLFSLFYSVQKTDEIEEGEKAQVRQIIETELGKLNLVDQALASGLATLSWWNYHCLILQKI